MLVRKGSFLSKRTDGFTFFTVTALFFAACAAALSMPSTAADGIRTGVDYSLNILLPSLFPFMFLAAFAAEYGISSAIGRYIAPFTEKVLYLPAEAGVTVLLSFVGGYPVGAVGIASLLKNKYISENQARRMLCFCVNPGPAFLISAVGDSLYKNRTIGLVLFLAQTTASLTIGIILGLFARRREIIPKVKKELAVRRELSASFILSTRLACGSAVSLCSLAVLFSAFSSLLLGGLNIGSETNTGIFLRNFLEVTDGCSSLCGARLPIFFTALAVGWGGLCVHFQVFAALPELRIAKLPFALSRAAVGTLGASLTYLIIDYFGITADVFSNIENTKAQLSSLQFCGSLALLISSIMFVVFLGRDTIPDHLKER